jgi:hypothetical protein
VWTDAGQGLTQLGLSDRPGVHDLAGVGAEPLVHLATIADADSVDGAYSYRLERRVPKGAGPGLAARLRERSE